MAQRIPRKISDLIDDVGLEGATILQRVANGEIIALCGLDNGETNPPKPGAVLLAKIQKYRDLGVPDTNIIWASLGTEVAITYGSGAAAGVSVTTSTGGITGTGIANGLGIATGVSAATSVASIDGVGVAFGQADLVGVSVFTSTSTVTGFGTILGDGVASLSAVSVTTSVADIMGVGVLLGTGSLTGVSASTTVGNIEGVGQLLPGFADLVGVSVVPSTGSFTGSGSGAASTGSFTGVSAATSVASIDSNAAPYSTITFSNFVDTVAATADMTGVSAATSTGTITGSGSAAGGTGSFTGVSAATSVGSMGSNAAPYSTVTFSNFAVPTPNGLAALGSVSVATSVSTIYGAPAAALTENFENGTNGWVFDQSPTGVGSSSITMSPMGSNALTLVPAAFEQDGYQGLMSIAYAYKNFTVGSGSLTFMAKGDPAQPVSVFLSDPAAAWSGSAPAGMSGPTFEFTPLDTGVHSYSFSTAGLTGAKRLWFATGDWFPEGDGQDYLVVPLYIDSLNVP